MREKMLEGINNCKCVVVFITERCVTVAQRTYRYCPDLTSLCLCLCLCLSAR